MKRVQGLFPAVVIIFLLVGCPGGPSASSEKAMVSFALQSPAVAGTIYDASGVISITLPEGTVPLGLIAVFETTGVRVTVDGIAQTSGVTENYFIPSRTYTVFAEDGTSREYTVTLNAAASPKLEGIDVSHYQGTIDWAKVRADGKKFAYIRASAGLTTDANFADNWSGAKAAGVFRGAYHFAQCSLDPTESADHFLSLFSSDSQPGDLPPLLDLEDTTLTAVERCVWARTWCDEVERSLGVRPVIYSGAYYWDSYMGSTDQFSAYPLCTAYYSAPATPVYPSAWKKWDFWQYSSSGTVSGITGSTDLIRFNGDIINMMCEGR